MDSIKMAVAFEKGSEYFRDAIQDRWAHDIKIKLLNTRQTCFPMLSNGYNNYIQFQTANPFTLW